MAKLLEAKSVAERIKQGIRLSLQNLKQAPVLASILIGDNPAASSFVQSQIKTAKGLGIIYKLYQLDANITEDKLKDLILAFIIF